MIFSFYVFWVIFYEGKAFSLVLVSNSGCPGQDLSIFFCISVPWFNNKKNKSTMCFICFSFWRMGKCDGFRNVPPALSWKRSNGSNNCSFYSSLCKQMKHHYRLMTTYKTFILSVTDSSPFFSSIYSEYLRLQLET